MVRAENQTATVGQGEEIGRRRVWRRPTLEVQSSLPRLTCGIAGSFDPNGGTANGGPGQTSGTTGMTRDWSNEP